MELETEQLEQLSEGPAGRARWSLDGTSVYFNGAEERRSNIWFVSVEGGTETRMTNLGGRPVNLVRPSLATDGTYLHFAWEESTCDIWVMDVVTNED